MNKEYFVWILFNGKPWPQKWYGDKVKSSNSKPMYDDSQLIFKKELTEQEKNLTLDELIVIYPAPELKEEKDAS